MAFKIDKIHTRGVWFVDIHTNGVILFGKLYHTYGSFGKVLDLAT